MKQITHFFWEGESPTLKSFETFLIPNHFYSDGKNIKKAKKQAQVFI